MAHRFDEELPTVLTVSKHKEAVFNHFEGFCMAENHFGEVAMIRL